jgi:DNA-damage-inducible protein J
VAQEIAVAANTVVRARIDQRVKKEAEAVLAAIGLTVSDAFRMLMVRVAAEKALPFEPIVPNKKTVKAIEAARRGELTTVGRPRNLVHRLNADD